jgi:putative transposase
MPRLACPEEPRSTLHVVQRGIGRSTCFSCVRDRAAYLEGLRELARQQQCAVHAYVLMGNHVHVLFTSSGAGGAARLMPALAAGYARYLAEAYGREDALWEERYDATPVQARAQLLHAMRYIEENPIRAGLVAHPRAYRWSSYRANALGDDTGLVTPHPHYYSLGRSPEARRAAYAALFLRDAEAALRLRGRSEAAVPRD